MPDSFVELERLAFKAFLRRVGTVGVQGVPSTSWNRWDVNLLDWHHLPAFSSRVGIRLWYNTVVAKRHAPATPLSHLKKNIVGRLQSKSKPGNPLLERVLTELSLGIAQKFSYSHC